MKNAFQTCLPVIFMLVGAHLEGATSGESLSSRIDRINASRWASATKQQEIARVCFEAANADKREVIESKNLGALLGLVDRWEREWKDGPANYSTRLFANAAAAVAPYAGTNTDASTHMERFAELAMNQAQSAPFEDVEFLKMQFALVHPMTGKAPIEVLDKEKLLAYLVGLQQRMEDYVAVPFGERVAAIGPRMSPESLRLTLGITPEELARLEPQTANHYTYVRHLNDWKYLTDTNRAPSRLDDSARQLAAFVQTRFTMDPADLQIVRRVLDKHLTDPSLKERLVQLIYRGRNPFLGLPEEPVAVGPTLAALTRKPLPLGSAGAPNLGSQSNLLELTTGEARQSNSHRNLPYLPLAAVFAAGVVLWWFLTRSRAR